MVVRKDNKIFMGNIFGFYKNRTQNDYTESFFVEQGKILDTTDLKTETRIALENISTILNTAGMKTDNVVKATVYMKDLKKF
mgnify:CR=1 FL=1